MYNGKAMEKHMEKWINKKTVHNGPIITLYAGEVELDDGSLAYREVITHSGGVVIVPVLGNEVILVRQFRIALEKEILELPAGRLEPDEIPLHCGIRELEEETGYRASKMILATEYYSSVGFANEKAYVFLAFDLQKTEQRLEKEERIKIEKYTIPEIKKMLLKKEIKDAKTIIGLRELLAYLEDGSKK
jgi:ADP-ribose pyrophosphatase